MDELLGGLRDIHAPPVPAGLSTGPVVAAAVIGLMAIIAIWTSLAYWRHGWKRQAMAALASCAALPPDQALAQAAVLLRRIAMLRGGSRVTKLSGDAWLQELDRQYYTRFFSRGEGRAFGDALYKSAPSAAVRHILGGVQRLLRRRSWLRW